MLVFMNNKNQGVAGLQNHIMISHGIPYGVIGNSKFASKQKYIFIKRAINCFIRFRSYVL